MPDRDLGWAPRQPGAECRNEERALGQAEDLLDHRTPVGPQHGAAVGHRYPDGERGETAHDRRDRAAQERVVAALAARADRVVARVDLRQEPWDLLGRVLQVRVERDHHRAAGVGEAGQHRRMLPGIAGERHHLHGGIPSLDDQ